MNYPSIINIHDELIVEPYRFRYEIGDFVQETFEPHDIYEVVSRALNFGDERYVVRRLKDDWHENYTTCQIEPANAMEVLAWQLK